MLDTFTMPDGRKVTVDFLSIESISSVNKEDWKTINETLSEAIEFIKSNKYIENLHNSFGLKMSSIITEETEEISCRFAEWLTGFKYDIGVEAVPFWDYKGKWLLTEEMFDIFLKEKK